ncbi:HNH endonuclease [Pseudonocardiaceae bacterium YIM PH 21723]|nr:HNH endonuclease [Pseudonocardiaceae bacterium YIM PH 21723]
MFRVVLATVALTVGLAAPAMATPPGIPDKATAVRELAELTVADEGSKAGYDRKKFKHWITIEGRCDTREMVLKRDGSGVSTDEDCHPVSGSWFSPYDNETLNDASDVDIDHFVPLMEACKSGASDWTDRQRQDFANDLDAPQLIAVSASSNRSKGDRDPAAWKPPAQEYWCEYSRMWVAVKHKYQLTLQESEKSAVQSMLDTCA